MEDFMLLPPRLIVSLAAVLALAACSGEAIHIAGTASDCGTAQARLAQIGIPESDIVEITNTVERANEMGILSRHAWARLKSCDGYVVVRTDSSCGRWGSQPYATGNCRVPEPRGT
jgi:hypothetical protein